MTELDLLAVLCCLTPFQIMTYFLVRLTGRSNSDISFPWTCISRPDVALTSVPVFCWITNRLVNRKCTFLILGFLNAEFIISSCRVISVYSIELWDTLGRAGLLARFAWTTVWIAWQWITCQLHACALLDTIIIMLAARIGYVGTTLAPYSVTS